MKRISLRSTCRLSSPMLRVSGAMMTLAAITGCQGDGPKVGLRSDDPAGRMIAMKQAGQTRDARALPALVEGLASDDPAERFYAGEALHRITGQTLDYHYYDTEEDRAKAVDRWKQWLAAQNRAATRRTK